MAYCSPEYVKAMEEERKALLAELSGRFVIGAGPRHNWTRFKRKGFRVRTKVLRYLNRTTSGKFAMGRKYIAFELEADALMYRIKYPL